MSIYEPSPIKRRRRRTAAEIIKIRAAIYEVAEQHHPVTVRQVFYALTTQGLIEKTEREYKTTICRLMKEMRLQGDLPFLWVADNSRWMRKPRTHSNLRSMLEISFWNYDAGTTDLTTARFPSPSARRDGC